MSCCFPCRTDSENENARALVINAATLLSSEVERGALILKGTAGVVRCSRALNLTSREEGKPALSEKQAHVERPAVVSWYGNA